MFSRRSNFVFAVYTTIRYIYMFYQILFCNRDYHRKKRSISLLIKSEGLYPLVSMKFFEIRLLFTENEACERNKLSQTNFYMNLLTGSVPYFYSHMVSCLNEVQWYSRILSELLTNFREAFIRT